jgi:hypothetical protein
MFLKKVDLKAIVRQQVEQREEEIRLHNEERARVQEKLQLEQEERDRHRIKIWDSFLRFCRPATVDDYLPWLEGYVRKHGADKLHYHDGPIESSFMPAMVSIGPQSVTIRGNPDAPRMADRAIMFVLASEPKSIPIAFGAAAFKVIVPSDIALPPLPTEGHSTFYFMSDFSTTDYHVTVFSDVARRILGKS